MEAITSGRTIVQKTHIQSVLFRRNDPIDPLYTISLANPLVRTVLILRDPSM